VPLFQALQANLFSNIAFRCYYNYNIMTSTTTSRHAHWTMMAGFATIALIALLKDFDKVKDQEKQVKWAVSGLSISLAMGGLAVFANMLLRDKFVGTHLEGGMATISMGFLAATLPAIMEPGADVATGTFGNIINPNLYFFSWGAFIASVFVLLGFMKDKSGSGEGATASDFNCSSWGLFMMTSFVTMVAAGRIFKDADCENESGDVVPTYFLGMDYEAFCDRTKFAIGLGTVSGLFALIWLPLGNRFIKNEWVHAFVAWLFLALWTIGVALITFGDSEKRPAQVLGNLYFFTWGSFAIIASLAATSMFKIFGMVMGTEEEEPATTEEKKEEEEKPKEDVEAVGGAKDVMVGEMPADEGET
jgi:hypothetical protein